MNQIEEKCCMYIDIINAMGKDSLLEPDRAKLHSEICDLVGIPHNTTKHITGDLMGVSGRQLYSSLLHLKEELKKKSKDDIIKSELHTYREIWGSSTRYTKEASVKIYNKLISIKTSCDEAHQFYIEMSLVELEMRHKLVFGNEIVRDVILLDNKTIGAFNKLKGELNE